MIIQEFISNEEKIYKYSLGKKLASALTGFIAGIIVTSFVWIAILNYLEDPFF